MIKQRKKIAAMLVASMIFATSLPNTAEAFKINWGTDPRVEQSWTDFAKNEAGKYKLHYTNMGLNEAWHDITKGWPLGAQMFLQVRPGTDSDKTYGNDEIAKKFDGHQLYCTGNHEDAVSIQPGSRAFMSEDYNLDPKNPNRFSIKNPNYNFNFLMLSIASALPMDGGTVPADTEHAFEDPYAPMGAVVQAIDWIITDHDGFEGANAALGQSDEDVRAAFIKDLNTFMTEGGYYSDLLNFDHPYIRSYVTAPPVAGSLGASLGLQNKAQSIFADVWYSAYLTCGMDPDWTKEFTSYKHPVEQENGEYVMELQFPSDPAISSYILGLTFSPYGDWKQVATSKENTLRFTSVTGECDENSSIGTLKYDSNKVGAMMPIDLTKAHMRTFDTYQPGKGFKHTQTQFGAYVENGLEIRVINGHSDNGGGGGKVDGQVVRYKHNEDWQATYNVNLFKFDSETGKPIEGSKWDILEKFDASQLDNTDLDRTKDAPGSYTSTAGSLNSTEWGDDTIADNFSGDTGVNTSDANKYNWANDSGTQFETWDDPHDDPCKRDKNVTGADGKLYEISSNGENSGDEAHSDLKKYTYTKGYCSGHPAPVIEYQELTGDPEEDAQIEEENQELHDAAWQAWYEEVETCEKLVEEGGFFHAIEEGAAQKAMEEDRDQFYKDFISITYDYSAEEIEAATGYILHGAHTDDIPIEWRTVTSSEYKDTNEATNLSYNEGAGNTGDAGEDGDDDADMLSLTDTASVIEEPEATVSENETVLLAPSVKKEENPEETAVSSDGIDEDLAYVEGKDDEEIHEVVMASPSNVVTGKITRNTSDEENVDEADIVEDDELDVATNSNAEEDIIEDDDFDAAANGDAEEDVPETEIVSTGFIATMKGILNKLARTIGLMSADEDENEDGGGDGGYLRNTISLEPSIANTVKLAASDIIDWTFIVYDHRTEGEIHINKRDFNLSDKTGDTYDDYSDENGDSALEGAVYGLFAADNIYHPDTTGDSNTETDEDTGIVFKKDELVAVATTDRNGDASFMAITEAPGSVYNYKTGSIEHDDWYENAPKNLHTNEAASAAHAKDIESFTGHNPDNSEITAGNGNDLSDTSTGDATYLWKNSTNQEYDSGMLGNNNVTNSTVDTYREDETSGHYPISNNEDNNGNCWIGRPIIVSGEHSAKYYVKELSRSEGYELSVYGEDNAILTNKDAFENGNITYSNGKINITNKPNEDRVNSGITFTLTHSEDTDNGYTILMTNIPEGAHLYTTVKKQEWDNNLAHPEEKTETVPVYADKDTLVMVGGKTWNASVGDTITYNGKTFTVNHTVTIPHGTVKVEPDNELKIENPNLNAATIEDSGNAVKDVNQALRKLGYRTPVKGSPWVILPVDSESIEDISRAINENIFANDEYAVFNALNITNVFKKGVKKYIAVSYCYKQSTVNNALYNEENQKIYVKTAVNFEGDVSEINGFVYRMYDLNDCENVEKNENGFVQSAVVPNQIAKGTVAYTTGNISDINFETVKDETVWAYNTGDQMLDVNGDPKVTTKTVIEYVKPTLVTKTEEKEVKQKSYTGTGTIDGNAVGTYEFTMSQADLDAYTGNDVNYILKFDNDESANKRATAIENMQLTAHTDMVLTGSYIKDVLLTYPGDQAIVQDGNTGNSPIGVYERPIRQSVKISKDINTLPETLKVWYCANCGTENDDNSDTCANCGRKRTVEATKSIDFMHDTYAAFFNEDLSKDKQNTNWIERAKNWFKTISGVKGSEDTSKAVPNFRFKAYLKSNIERLYRNEDGQVLWVDRNGNRLTPVYKDLNGDGLYDTFEWQTVDGTNADFPEIDKETNGAIESTNVQKIYTEVQHNEKSMTTSGRANNVWSSYQNPSETTENGIAEKDHDYTYSTNERIYENNPTDPVNTNESLYSYVGTCTNVGLSDKINENQNAGYTRLLEMTGKTMENGAGKTLTIDSYNYEKFFDALNAANTDKWDDDIDSCTFKYNGYDTPVGKISMQAYPGQHWEDTLKEENQKGDANTSFDLFRWIHQKIHGSVTDYEKYKGDLNGENIETETSTSDYARANAEASNVVRQFAVKWYLQDEVAKLVKNNGVGDGEDIAKTEADGGAPGITEEGVVPYDDYIHDYALFKALEKAYNYLRPFYENDLDTIYSVTWDSAENGGNDKDVTTLSTDSHEEGAFYNTSAYLPYGTYVIVEQTPENSMKETGYDLVNRAFNIEKPKEVIVPSVYDGAASNDTTDNYDTHYNFDPEMTMNDMAASVHDGKEGYLIRFGEEWQNNGNGDNEHVIRAHGYDGDYEVFKYGLNADKLGQLTGNSILSKSGEYAFKGFTFAQSIFDPLKDYYAIGHAGESKNGTRISITEKEGGQGTNEERFPIGELPINKEETANGTTYDVNSLINRFNYASVSEDNGNSKNVLYKGGTTDDNNVSGMQFKDARSVTGQQTAYEGKYASMLVPWSVVKPADMKNYSSEEFTGCADVNERNTFKTATLTLRKVDAETGEQILHDDTTFGIYAASRYDTEEEIMKDAEKLSGNEKTKFVNQFKPGDTKFYLEDTKVYGSREFLEAMGAYDIDYLLTLSDHKAKRYQGNGYEDVSESKIKDILGKDGYTTKTGTVEYGIYHYDILSGTSLPDDEKVTWYYSVYNTDSPLCIGTIPKGTPICSEKNAVILQDDFGNRTGMLKSYSTMNDVLMENENKAGTTGYHLQNTGYMRTPQPLGSGCYVVAELKTPYGYLRAKPEAHELYSGVDYYYEGGDMFKKTVMVDYQKRIDKMYSYEKPHF